MIALKKTKYGIIISLLVALFAPRLSVAQDLYQPLECQGPVPSEFLKYTEDIINESMANGETKDFGVNARLNIKDLLQSGTVLFGDSVSAYISSIAKEILNKNNIEDNIGFYVLRSPIFNAFSTDQGFIFITTGAIAQSNNREELAFILCHELAHYIRKHNYLAYKKRQDLSEKVRGKNASIDTKLESYYKYSRANELEADSLGAILYLKCGFSKENMYRGLANLAPESRWVRGYQWNPEYLEDDKFHFPEIYLEFDATREERYQNFYDSKPWWYTVNSTESEEQDESDIDRSTHPDWEERLDKIVASDVTSKELKNILDSKTQASEPFMSMKKLCYMEMLFSLFSSAQYARAHYLTLELEHVYGSSDQLNYYRWLSLNNLFYKYFYNKYRFAENTRIVSLGSDGWNISHMIRFFTLLSAEEWYVVLTRESMKLKMQYGQNTTIDHYLGLAMANLKEEVNSSLTHFSSGVLFEDEEMEEVPSKKEVKRLRKAYIQTALKTVADAHRQEVSDLFEEEYTIPESGTNYYTKTYWWGKDQMVETSKKPSKNADTILFGKPRVHSFHIEPRSAIPTLWKDEVHQENIASWINSAAVKNGVYLVDLDKTNKDTTSSVLWNDNYILDAWVKERVLSSSQLILPVYSSYTDQLRSRYNGQYYLFSSTVIFDNGYTDSPYLTWLKPIVFPYLALRRVGIPDSEVQFTFILVNLNRNEVTHVQTERIKHQFTDDLGKSQYYDSMYEIKKSLGNE